MDMDKDMIQAATATVFAAVGAYFHELAGPLALLVIVMGLDYCSGMLRAWEKHILSSKIGLLGIVKKLSYMFAVAVAITVDMVAQIAVQEVGINLTGCYFCALLVTVWLILNECISILENIEDIGVPIPEFLLKLVRRLKQSAEQRGEEQADAASGVEKNPDGERKPKL